jgi:hypothetical protein
MSHRPARPASGGAGLRRQEGTMSRTVLNLVIDTALAVLFLAMMATGYLLRFPLPPGTNKELLLWGLTRHGWGSAHFWMSLALVSVLAVHLTLHWQWVVSVVGRRLVGRARVEGHPLVTGGLSILLLAGASILFAWAAQRGVRPITEMRPDVCPPPPPDRTETVRSDGATGPDGAVTGARAKVRFWEEVYPILEKSCLPCHGPTRQRGDFRIDREQDFLGGGGREPLVLPGRAAESPLIALVSGSRKDIAFPERHRLPESQVLLLKAWIDAGAEWPERTPK